MSDKKVSIVMTTYNNEEIIEKTINSILSQDYENMKLVIADDGSTDKTPKIISSIEKVNSKVIFLSLPHQERGIARKTAIDKVLEVGTDYLFIIDSDMVFKEKLVKSCVDYLENSDVGALIIPELPFSEYNNYFTKVKIFERTVINSAGTEIGKNSIEAARFWKIEEYIKTGGLNPKQISFEETQPTIRYVEMNGKIKRAVFTGVLHDEKHVTISNLLKKKSYYFSVMPQTLNSEKNGFLKALQRWYFFRPVLYRGENLVRYIKHPLLTAGMLYMYAALTFIGVKAILGTGKK